MPKKTQNSKDDGQPIFVYYKGARIELRVVNSTIRRFRKLGGDFEKAQQDPEEQVILLLMAALKLEGKAEDHEDDFESLLSLANKVKLAMERYQVGTGTPGELSGGALVQPPEFATD